MKPGPELDALVAEKVMGRKREHEFDNDSDDPTCYYCNAYLSSRGRPCAGDPPYSTDIAAAWEVVEHMIERDMRVNVSTCYQPDDGTPWICTLERHESQIGDPNKWTEYAETAPEAICKAALAAVGVKHG